MTPLCRQRFSLARLTRRAARVGVVQARRGMAHRFVLAAGSGIFIAIAAVFFTTLSALPPGLVSVLARGLCFALGLIPVLLGGELFPSMVTCAAARLGGEMSARESACGGLIVLAGNVIGILFFAALMVISGLCATENGGWGLRLLQLTTQHGSGSFVTHVAQGMAGNVLLCAALAASYACRALTDKILVMLAPLCLFAASGAGHCMVSLTLQPLFAAVRGAAAPEITAFLLPITLGNLLGGAAILACCARYLRPQA